MVERNPYYISFGRIPTKYISRNVVIDSIVETLDSDVVEEQAFKITGIRGTGKTVTLTAIENKLRRFEDWIIVDLKSLGNIIEELVAELYSQVAYISEFVDKELNLSKFGIGMTITNKKPVACIDHALKEILNHLRKKEKRVLVVIDEARCTDEMASFIQLFQILIREEMPIYLLIAGLYEDVESLENKDGLTFFLRATKYEMTPLNFTSMRDDYEKTIGVDRRVAEEMATMTKGYPFAYQVLGKYMWEEPSKEITEDVLTNLDEALALKVYSKIWSELTTNDRMFMKYIAQKDEMSASELLEMVGKKHNEWSEPRRRLKEKGIIDVSTRGLIKMKLPRFKEFIEAYVN